MEEFLKEAFRVERELVHLSYWISALEWGHHGYQVSQRAERARATLDNAITALSTLRSEMRMEEE